MNCGHYVEYNTMFKYCLTLRERGGERERGGTAPPCIRHWLCSSILWTLLITSVCVCVCRCVCLNSWTVCAQWQVKSMSVMAFTFHWHTYSNTLCNWVLTRLPPYLWTSISGELPFHSEKVCAQHKRTVWIYVHIHAPSEYIYMFVTPLLAPLRGSVYWYMQCTRMHTWGCMCRYNNIMYKHQ